MSERKDLVEMLERAIEQAKELNKQIVKAFNIEMSEAEEADLDKRVKAAYQRFITSPVSDEEAIELAKHGFNRDGTRIPKENND